MACSRAWIVALLFIGGCQPKEDNTENVLIPGTSSGDATTTMTMSEDSSTTIDVDIASGGEVVLPATYRFECVDIQGVGNGDGTVIQAQVLENTWSADIDNYKLNIMLEVVERDEAAGAATLGIRSGIGPDAGSLCAEPTSQSEMIDVTYTPAMSLWQPMEDSGVCNTAATSSEGGTYVMSLTPADTVYIYAQDTNTVTFNCTPDDSPDAVPIHAVEAEVSTNADETIISGVLTGCLVASEAMALCSCLVMCNGNTGPGDLQTEGECAGCPTGGIPLVDLLGDVGTSDNCTTLMGADAYDLKIAFNASRLPNVPTTCG